MSWEGTGIDSHLCQLQRSQCTRGTVAAVHCRLGLVSGHVKARQITNQLHTKDNKQIAHCHSPPAMSIVKYIHRVRES